MYFPRLAFTTSAACRYLLATALLLIHLPTYATCETEELVHGWGGDWVPFVMGTPKKPSGLDMDILDAIIKEAGCRWHNTNYPIPWARHLKLIESGGVDLATAASWTEERAKYAYFTHPYRNEHVAIFILKENLPKFSGLSLEQLGKSNFRLGSVRGEVYGKVMGALVSKLGKNVYPIENNTQNIQKLIHDRIDGYVGHLPNDSLFVNEQNPEKEIVILPSSLTPTGDIHIMMSKKSTTENDLKALNQAIEILQENGTIALIKKKYSKQFNAKIY